MRDREAHFDSSAATAGQKLVLKIQDQPHRVSEDRPGRAVPRSVVAGGDDGIDSIETGQVTGASPGSRPCRTTPPSRMCSAEDNT